MLFFSDMSASTCYVVPGKAWRQAVTSLPNISAGECRQRLCRATWKEWLLLPQETPRWKWWEVHPGLCTFRRNQKNATDALWPAKPTSPSGLGAVDCCIVKREPGALGALCVQTHPCEPYRKTCSSYHFFHPPPPVPSRWLHPLVSFLTLRTAF